MGLEQALHERQLSWDTQEVSRLPALVAYLFLLLCTCWA